MIQRLDPYTVLKTRVPSVSRSDLCGSHPTECSVFFSFCVRRGFLRVCLHQIYSFTPASECLLLELITYTTSRMLPGTSIAITHLWKARYQAFLLKPAAPPLGKRTVTTISIIKRFHGERIEPDVRTSEVRKWCIPTKMMYCEWRRPWRITYLRFCLLSDSPPRINSFIRQIVKRKTMFLIYRREETHCVYRVLSLRVLNVKNSR